MWSRICLPFRSTRDQPQFFVRLVLRAVFGFICCFLCTIICLFVFLIFSHGVVSLFSIYELDCSSGIFHPSFKDFIVFDNRISLIMSIWSTRLPVVVLAMREEMGNLYSLNILKLDETYPGSYYIHIQCKGLIFSCWYA